MAAYSQLSTTVSKFILGQQGQFCRYLQENARTCPHQSWHVSGCTSVGHDSYDGLCWLSTSQGPENHIGDEHLSTSVRDYQDEVCLCECLWGLHRHRFTDMGRPTLTDRQKKLRKVVLTFLALCSLAAKWPASPGNCCHAFPTMMGCTLEQETLNPPSIKLFLSVV